MDFFIEEFSIMEELSLRFLLARGKMGGHIHFGDVK
jgi:hypothetical protein